MITLTSTFNLLPVLRYRDVFFRAFAAEEATSQALRIPRKLKKRILMYAVACAVYPSRQVPRTSKVREVWRLLVSEARNDYRNRHQEAAALEAMLQAEDSLFVRMASDYAAEHAAGNPVDPDTFIQNYPVKNKPLDSPLILL